MTSDSGISFLQGIDFSDLKGIKTQLLRYPVHLGFSGEGWLGSAKTAHGSAGDVVGVYSIGIYFNVRNPVGSAGKTGGAKQNLSSQRSISSGISQNLHLHGHNSPLSGSPGAVVQILGMSFGMDSDGLLATEDYLDWPFGVVSSQSREDLNHRFFLASKSSSRRKMDHPYFFFGKVEDG
ncbi:MAG: hypothetical protein DDT18_01894 [Actinobacteria bacterium]|nr:hypothetical protein [Actinomycetota bacterium]